MAEEKFIPSSFKTHTEELDFLRSLGFATNPQNFEADTLDEVWQKVDEISQKREDLSYHIDGVVVKIDDNELASELGVVGKAPRGWCAVKFPAQEAATKVVGLVWQVGRTGRLTPVVELESVLLDGTVVKRATLHNYKEVLEKDLILGDTVIIHKAGDIIPEVVKVLYNLRDKKTDLKKLEMVDKCPSCNTKLLLTDTGVDLVCPNTSGCRAQVVGRLSYYCQRNIANIEGLSEKNLDKFIDEFKLKDIPDLYNLPYEEIFEMEGFGRKSVDNLIKALEKSRKIEDYKFLAGLSIEGVGPEVAKLICEKIYQNEDYLKKSGQSVEFEKDVLESGENQENSVLF